MCKCIVSGNNYIVSHRDNADLMIMSIHTHSCIHHICTQWCLGVCASTCHSPCPVWGKHALRCNKNRKPRVPLSQDQRLFESSLSDLQGEGTQRRLNLRPLSCRMSLSRTFVFTQVPGWSLNQIPLTCSGDACSGRDGVCYLPEVMLCLPKDYV